MGKIYLLYRCYSPNTAYINRMLSYLRAWEDEGEKVEIVFFMPDEKKSKIAESFRHIKITYMWEKYYLDNKLLKYFCYAWYVYCFTKRLKHDDVVYFYGLNDILKYVIDKQKCKYYVENTENPEVSLVSSRLHRCTVEEHIECVKKIDGLFVISKNLRDYYISKGVSESNIHIINMTVDPSRFENLKRTFTKDKYIAYCGTVSNKKDGADQLIKAFALVARRYPDYKLYIIGNTQLHVDEVENIRLIQKLGISDKVIFTGMVTADDMPQLLKNAQVLALNRPDNIQAKYGFPTKLGEYLLTGNPVVVTSVGNIPDFLVDGESAFLSPPNNPEKFAANICLAIENDVLARSVGENGKKIALENFNCHKEAMKLISLMK